MQGHEVERSEGLKMTLHVHMLQTYSESSEKVLRDLLEPSIRLTQGSDVVEPESVSIVVGGFPSEANLDACPNLKAVIVPFAGVPAETQDLLRARPNVDLHSLHFNFVPTAEMAITLLMAAEKLVVPLDRDLRKNDWTNRYVATAAGILDGKTALILGYGQIGKRIAMSCHGLGMKCIGVRRSVESVHMENGVPVYPVSALHTLLPRTDALMMALPGTPHTDGMIGAAEIALLPAHAIIVNVGRGPTIDEEALYAALKENRIRAAGLDVWWSYPKGEADRTTTPPSRFPYHELDNVVMSPHRGGWLSEAESNRSRALAELLNAAARGEVMPSKVDKELGY